jgi:hypothetical protein
VILDLSFVAAYLPIQLVRQIIDGSVQISMGTFGKQVAALDMQVAFGTLALFLLLHVVHRQKNSHIHHLIEMPGNTIQLTGHIAAQCRGDFKVMAANRQVHKETPFPKTGYELKNAAKRVMQGQRTGTLSWIYYARSTLQLQAVALVKKGNLLTKSLQIYLLN